MNFCGHDYNLASISLSVTPLTEGAQIESESLSSLSWVKKAGVLGEGSDLSPANMATTASMLGLSSARCCTHNKPMCIDRNTW